MAKRKTKAKPFSDQLRDAVRDSEHTRYRIAVECNIDHGAMSHFLAGHRGLSLDSIDRLAAFLDLRIVRGSKTRR
jgi:hypothetical protein